MSLTESKNAVSPTVRGAWFDADRFGMFIHWGIASVRGIELSWPLAGGLPGGVPADNAITPEEYWSLASSFAPDAWDARALAALAKKAGMRYAVFTTRHHDGFSMFPSKFSDYSVATHFRGRDLVREFVDAFRQAGLRVGLYYSLSDWHHPDYPRFRESFKPYIFGGWWPPLPTSEQWERYRGYVTGQIRELLTNYGPIDVMWFDGDWERPRLWWRGSELETLIRELQPDILINDRFAGQGDFITPEQLLPGSRVDRRWESCMTMNESWAWNPADTEYKSVGSLIHTLCETAAGGGNLLLNVSPTEEGQLPSEQVERLEAIGDWLGRHGEAVYSTTPALEPWQFYGPATRCGNTVYLFLLSRPYEAVALRGMPIDRVGRVYLLGTGEDLVSTVHRRADVHDEQPIGEVRIVVPEESLDPIASVVAVELGRR